MAYYTEVLEPDEKVRFIGAIHWIRFLPGVLLAVVAMVVLLAAAGQGESGAVGMVALAGVIAALAAWTLFANWLRQRTTEIVITDKRLIHKTGLIARQTQEINVSKVETVLVDQSLFGRLFDYGTVTIKGTGGSWEPLAMIRAPLRLRSAIITA
ncbi:hypothetical protein IP88_00240 [alpha proteobacterium AAP81b]|nr:hypothetical protein IP88_00240 [alpha proteobacterium AAP81b]